MGHRVIALARSGKEIRAAVVETRLRRFELKSVLKFDLGPVGSGADSVDAGAGDEQRLETVGAALNRVLVPGLTTSDSVVVAFPGESAFIRRLSFPFRDRARIAEVLPVELGGTLPTGLDANLHTNFEKAGEEGGDIIAVGVQKEALSGFLGSWRAEGIDPVYVGMESLELASLLPFLSVDGEEERNLMLVWVDGRNVEFLVSRGSTVVLSRAICLNSKVFDGQELGMAFIREALLSMAAASESGAPLDMVYVCGREATFVAPALSEALSIVCDVLDPASIGIPGAQNCSGLDSGMTRVAALAMGMAGGTGPASLNIRSGEFNAEGAAGLLREKARFFTVALVIFALLGAGWATVRYVGLVNDRNAIEKQLVEYASTLLGQEVTDVDAALATVKAGSREELGLFPEWTSVAILEKIVKSVVAAGNAGNGAAADGSPGAVAADGTASEGAVPAPDALGALPGSGGAPGAAGAMGVDLGMGAAEPADMGWAMELESIRIEPKQAFFKGEGESIEKVDELMSRLRADPCFSEVVTESTERVQFQRHQGWQKFGIRMNVDCAAGANRRTAREDAQAAPAAPAASEPVEAEQGGGVE